MRSKALYVHISRSLTCGHDPEDARLHLPPYDVLPRAVEAAVVLLSRRAELQGGEEAVRDEALVLERLRGRAVTVVAVVEVPAVSDDWRVRVDLEQEIGLVGYYSAGAAYGGDSRLVFGVSYRRL